MVVQRYVSANFGLTKGILMANLSTFSTDNELTTVQRARSRTDMEGLQLGGLPGVMLPLGLSLLAFTGVKL